MIQIKDRVSGYSQNVDPYIQQAINEIQSEYTDDVSVDVKAKGLIKFGRNESVGTSRTEITTLPGTEVEETYVSSNAITTVVSISTSDTQTLSLLEGHTISGSDLTFIKQTDITLTGQTPVTLPTALARCTRGRLSAPANGTISFYQGGSIDAGVPDDDNQVHLIISQGEMQTQKGSTSISSVDYWIITSFTVSVLEKTASFVDARIEKKSISDTYFHPICQSVGAASSSGTVQIHFAPYLVVPKNHDVRVTAVANTTGIDTAAGIMGYLAKVI